MKPKIKEAMDTTTAAYRTRMLLSREELKKVRLMSRLRVIEPLIDSDCFVVISPRVASESP